MRSNVDYNRVAIYVSLVGLSDYTVTTNSDTMVK